MSASAHHTRRNVIAGLSVVPAFAITGIPVAQAAPRADLSAFIARLRDIPPEILVAANEERQRIADELEEINGVDQALTLNERVARHVEGIKQTMRKVHPELDGFAECVEVQPGCTGSLVMIAARLKA